MKKIFLDSLITDMSSPTLVDSVVKSRPVGNIQLEVSISDSDIRELEKVLELEFGEKITLKITDDIDTDF